MNVTTDNIYVLVIAGMVSAFLLVMGFILLHVRGQNKLLQQRELLQKAEIEHQKSLLSAVIQSQETERKRIGRDLHDDVGSALANLRLTIDMFKANKLPSPEDLNQFSAVCKNAIDRIITDVRHISHNLSPPRLTLFGLNSALEDLVDIIPRSGLKLVLVNPTPEILGKLDITAATTLYRVFEELIHNTIKHAAAAHIYITIGQDAGTLTIGYRDDGVGIHTAGERKTKKGMGMQNIESRLNMIKAVYEISEIGQPGFTISIKYTLAT